MCKVVQGLFGFASIWCFAMPASATDMLRRLGYGDDAKALIIHADDLGMSHAVNEASIGALENGIVTSGSIMVPCPWFPEIAAYCREHPELDVGLHLTLTSEWKYYRWRPVASLERVPGLIDEEGFLWRSVEQVAQHATPQEVETELRAQIERALQFGVKPTHIDSHMGTLFAKPEFFNVYVQLGREYGLPPMLINPTLPVRLMMRARGLSFSDAQLNGLQQSGLPMLDVLNTGEKGDSYEARKAAYHHALRNLAPGVTQIIVHLSTDAPEIRHIMNWWQRRHDEFRIFTDAETRQLIDDLGIHLIGWREMQALMPVSE